MTSRPGVSARRNSAESYRDNVELTRTPSQASTSPHPDIEEELAQVSDPACSTGIDDDPPSRPDSGPSKGLEGLRRLMSRSPLLKPWSAAKQRGYETLTADGSPAAQLQSGEPSQSRAPKGLSKRRSASHSRSELQETFLGGIDISAGHAKVPEGFIPEALEDEAGEEAVIDIDEDESDENPPDNSIYPQVRASVSAIDDISLSISTPRMWILSLIFALLGSGSNLFFSLRYPSVAITPVIALILVHPLGLLWDATLKRHDDPELEFQNGYQVARATDSSAASSGHSALGKLRLWLSQGNWNEKEHACVYISSNVAFGFAFATDVIVEQKMFYHQDLTITYQILLTISTQILGYAFAGITRRYLVRPPSMIWPATLMSAAMFTTMHKSDNKPANGWRVSRWNFFVLVWGCGFLWYFMPGLIMPALSYFNVLTWFAPDNVVVANLFGVSSGLGLFPVTFDWAQIAYIGSPLLTPWWAAANVVGGLAIVMWIIAPIMYYSNTFYSAYMPILSSSVFDNTGHIYDVSKILTPDFLFDEEAFLKYSPIYLPVTYVLSYAVQFAGLTALATHTVCWHGKDIWQQTKESFSERHEKGQAEYRSVNQDASADTADLSGGGPETASRADSKFEFSMSGGDVHNRLMERYEDAPISWYLIIFFAMLAVAIFIVEYYPVYLPWYGLLLALSITTVLFLPVAIIMAITNQHSSLYLISQLICGYVFPGRPVANMVFTTYAYISSTQGIKFSSDLKLGHYMKIPPKILFAVQLGATLVSSLTQIGVLNWMFIAIPGLCTPQAINGFSCPIARVHFNGSILWGVVGPQRFFGTGALYSHLVWAFLLGAIAPVAAWLVARRRPDSSNLLRKLHFPLLLGSISWIPPATGLNFSVWALVCWLFNYRIRRRADAWWAKYNMTLSAALDCGLAFGLLVVFFGFAYPDWEWIRGFRWWGTEVYKAGCDWRACSLMNVPEGQHFGPP